MGRRRIVMSDNDNSKMNEKRTTIFFRCDDDDEKMRTRIFVIGLLKTLNLKRIQNSKIDFRTCNGALIHDEKRKRNKTTNNEKRRFHNNRIFHLMLLFFSFFFLSMLAIGRHISNPRITRCAAFLALSAAFSLGKFSSHAFATPINSSRSGGTCCTSATSSCLAYSTITNTMTDATTSSLTVAQIPCLNDNYGYLIHDETMDVTAAIDTPDAAAIQAELDKRGWKLTHIFNTHHHWDHTGGNIQLKKDNDNVKIYGPASEKIPGMDIGLKGGDVIEFGSFHNVQVIDVGGHTSGHIAYYFPISPVAKAFVGDSLFALGCGKMFEGTPVQFWTSLQRLRNLPDDTLIYCAHEYTESNAKFAMSIEPGNTQLVQRVQEIKTMRARGEPTVPSLLGLEKQTNPFLRCDVSDEIRRHVGVQEGVDSPANAFAKVRKAKDNFRG